MIAVLTVVVVVVVAAAIIVTWCEEKQLYNCSLNIIVYDVIIKYPGPLA